MSKRFTYVLAGMTIPLAIFGSVYAGYRFTSNESGEAPAAAEKPVALKTTTTTLPDKTNNAWEIPAFNLQGLDGKSHRLDEWKGKVIMLNFWASWCGPCQYEIPEFVTYQKNYSDKGLQIIGVGVDEARKLRNVARSLEMNYPVLILDPFASKKVLSQWGNKDGLIPHTVVINRDGRIKYIHRGRMGEAEFNNYVFPLL